MKLQTSFRSIRSALLTIIGLSALSLSHMAYAAACSGPLDIHLSYQVQNDLTVPITDIMTFNQYSECGGPGAWWSSSAATGSSTIIDPFSKSSSNMPIKGLMLGLAQNLPGDAIGQQHVVMMVDDTAAAGAASIAWGTTFFNTNEATIISDLTSQSDTAINDLFSFVSGDASSMWFSLPANPQPGTTTTSQFTVVAWTDGQVVGTGTATLQYDGAQTTVPEPATIALLGLSLVGLGLSRRKRMRS